MGRRPNTAGTELLEPDPAWVVRCGEGRTVGETAPFGVAPQGASMEANRPSENR